ncbi:hypothetical protein FRB90_004185 [Tulasnella sp. 427]|nr:hypothetical protein FRB90_004185 [Tulasnella sp. 427]
MGSDVFVHVLRRDPSHGVATVRQILLSEGLVSKPTADQGAERNETIQIGVTASAFITIVGLLGFVFLQLSDDTAAYDTEARPPVSSPDAMSTKNTAPSPPQAQTTGTNYWMIGGFRRPTIPYERDEFSS